MGTTRVYGILYKGKKPLAGCPSLLARILGVKPTQIRFPKPPPEPGIGRLPDKK